MSLTFGEKVKGFVLSPSKRTDEFAPLGFGTLDTVTGDMICTSCSVVASFPYVTLTFPGGEERTYRGTTFLTRLADEDAMACYGDVYIVGYYVDSKGYLTSDVETFWFICDKEVDRCDTDIR